MACTVLVPLIASAAYTRQVKQYEASSAVFLPTYTTLALDPVTGNLELTPAGGITGDESDLASGVVADQVAAKLGYRLPVDTSVSDTQDVVTFTVRAADPARAVAAANAYAEVFAAQPPQAPNSDDPNAQLIAQLEAQRATASPYDYTWIDNQIASLQLNDQVVDTANRFNSAIRPVVLSRASGATSVFSGYGRALATSLAAGVLLGIILALVFDRLDLTLRTRRELEDATGLGVLGVLPASADPAGADGVLAAPDGAHAHAHRTLGLAFEFAALQRPMRLVQLTSAGDADGTTATLVNLAVSEAMVDRRVIVADLDLRRPGAAAAFGIARNAPGFTSVLLELCTVGEALVQPDPALPLWVLPPGPMPPNPADFLAIRGVDRTIHAVAGLADLVLVDTPNLLSYPDALTVAGFVDAVLLVARLHHTRRTHVHKAVARLAEVDAPLIGSVLVGVRDDELLALVTDASLDAPLPGHGPVPARRERDAVLAGSVSSGEVERWSLAKWSAPAWGVPAAPQDPAEH